MNKIWTFFVFVSVVMIIFTDPSVMLTEMTESVRDVLVLCSELLAVYTIWMGIMELIDASGVGEKIAKLLSPIIRRLFNLKDKEAEKYIALNISSNMLGLGSASTPMGIKAMKLLDNKSGKITKQMIMLFIINSTSIQLLPTTVVGIRASVGSQDPASIILPTFVATVITCTTAVLITKLIQIIIEKTAVKKNEHR